MAGQPSEAVPNPTDIRSAVRGEPQDRESAQSQQPEAGTHQGKPDLPPEAPISLALSGGGFRATLFHLGVLWFLHQTRRLQHVKWICSVSGGSILAAHVVQNWEEYASGSHNRFEKVAEGIIRFVRSDVRGRIFRGQILLALLYFASIPLIAQLYSIDALAYLRPLGDYLTIPIQSVGKPWPYLLVLVGLFALVLYCFLIFFWIADGSINWIVRPFKKPWLHRPFSRLFLPAVVVSLFVLDTIPWIVIALLVILWHLLLLDARLFTWLPWARATSLLQRHYDTLLFAAKSMSSLSLPNAVRPDLHLLATNMTTGKLCSFNAQGYIEDVLQHVQAPPPGPLEGGTLAIATGVAASSAFPPVFPPIVLRKRRDLKNIDYSHRLTDGGVNDNLGITLLKTTRPTSDLRIVSDAGASFDIDRDQRFVSRASWIIRVTDVLMRRVGEADTADFAQQLQSLDLVCDIRHVPLQAVSGFSPDFAVWLEKVRTDLDWFSELEIRALVLHGYAVAKEKWCEKFAAPNTHGLDAIGTGVTGFLPRLERQCNRLTSGWRGDELLNPAKPANTRSKLRRAGSRFRIDISLLAYVPVLLLTAFVACIFFDQLYRQPNKARLMQAEQTFATEVKDAVWTACRHFGDTLADQPPENANARDVDAQRRFELWMEFRRKLLDASTDRLMYEQLSELPPLFYGDLTQPTLGYLNYDEIARGMFEKALEKLKLTLPTNDPTSKYVQDELHAAHRPAREQLADTIRCRLRTAASRMAASRGETVHGRPLDAAVPKMTQVLIYRDNQNDVLIRFECQGGRLSNGQLCYELVHTSNVRPDDVPYSSRRAVAVRETERGTVQLRIPAERFDGHWYLRMAVEYPVDEPKVGQAVHVAPTQ